MLGSKLGSEGISECLILNMFCGREEKSYHSSDEQVYFSKHLFICPCAQAFKIGMISCAYHCLALKTLFFFCFLSFQDNLNSCPNPGI